MYCTKSPIRRQPKILELLNRPVVEILRRRAATQSRRRVPYLHRAISRLVAMWAARYRMGEDLSRELHEALTTAVVDSISMEGGR